MKLEEICRVSTDVAATRSRRAKVERLASCLAALAPTEVPIAVAYLSGALPHGSIGVGWATIKDVPAPASEARGGAYIRALSELVSQAEAGPRREALERHLQYARAAQDHEEK